MIAARLYSAEDVGLSSAVSAKRVWRQEK